MAYWLARPDDRLAEDWIKRFDPRFWTVTFPRPAMGSVVTTGPDALRVDCVFYQRQDRVALTWESVDGWSHPLLAYETARDYGGLVLSFRWRSSGGISPLDAADGPTLTIEGRDASGTPRRWQVRLWAYATGSDNDARVTLDFDALTGGLGLPAEAGPLWAGDIDRMYFSIAPEGHGTGSGVLPVPAVGQVEISDICCEGGGATLGLGDALVPPHRLRMATDYDGLHHLTPARVLHNILHLGYREWISHAVGTSRYFRLAHDAGLGRFVVADAEALKLNAATRAWHADFFARASGLGFRVIDSLSFGVPEAHCPEGWKQRNYAGAPALAEGEPPCTLISPCSVAGMNYLQAVALEFCALASGAGLPVDFQVREPGWWAGSGPCFYDAATVAAYTAETGLPVPARHQLATELPGAAQQQFLNWLGVKLGAATLALRNTVKGAHAGATVALAFSTPQATGEAAPMLTRVNMPESWAHPAFDALQVEDHRHITAENWGAHAKGMALTEARFGYPRARQQYLAGFVVRGEDRHQWRAVSRSIENARAGNYAEVFVRALPQVMRDGLTFYDVTGEDEVGEFHDVRFPLDVGLGAGGGPEFSTTVIGTASGFEQRNINWAEARGRYDAGPGVRGEADLATVTAFFRARRGRAFAFRFRDPFDFASGAPGAAMTALDQVLGTGDGGRTGFALVKRYGEADGHARRITRPVAGTVRVAVSGSGTINYRYLWPDFGQEKFPRSR